MTRARDRTLGPGRARRGFERHRERGSSCLTKQKTSASPSSAVRILRPHASTASASYALRRNRRYTNPPTFRPPSVHGCSSVSLTTQAAPRAARRPRSSSQEGCRNSNAYRYGDAGSASRNALSRPGSRFMFGGHWNRIGPRRSPSGAAASRKASAGAGSVKRRKCVMFCFALSTNRKSSGVAASQPSIVLGDGSRRNV
jgi:hypothetical protein